MKATTSFLVAALCAVAALGCGGVPEAWKAAEFPACTAAVEGAYRALARYEGRVPAMILKKVRGEYRILPGKAVSVGPDGVLFDQDREGPFYDPEPKLYPADQVECVIDSARDVVFGSLPADRAHTWDLEIEWRNTADTTLRYRFVLEANQQFSYCLPPGTYEAKRILFTRGEDIAEGMFLPHIELVVATGVTGLVGTLRLDLDSAAAPGVCAIPYKMIHTSSTGWGAMFGLVGGLVEGLTTDYGIQGGHRLGIGADTSSARIAKLPLRQGALRLEPNPLVPGGMPKR